MKLNRLLLILLFLVNTTAQALPTAKITVRVIDENGAPLEGVEVGIGFMSPVGKGEGWGSESSGVVSLTDSDGLFIGEGATQPYVSFGAGKKDYYGSGGEFTPSLACLVFMAFVNTNPGIRPQSQY